jgi:hypothetical protein
MNTERNNNSISRKAFLKFKWRDSDTVNPSDQNTKIELPNLRVESIISLQIGSATRIKHLRNAYIIRLVNSFIIIDSICKYDNSPATWRPNEKSEDSLSKTGRFYCGRCASIYDRAGNPVSGPSESPLEKLFFNTKDSLITIDGSRKLADTVGQVEQFFN